MKTKNRSLGSFERMSWLIDQTRCSHFALAAKISGKASIGEWQTALNAVQERHPILSMGINGNNIYEPFFEFEPDVSIPIRIVETVDPDQWEREIEYELSLPFDHTQVPLLRAVLVKGENNSVIILSVHHAIADGIGLSYLVRDLVMALSGIPLQRLAMSLSPDILLGKSDTLLATMTIAENPISNFQKEQQKPQFEQIKFSTKLTKSIVETSKKERTTVHGAICAALVIAGRRLSEEMNNRPMTLLASASCRKAVGLADECGVYVTTKSSTFPVQKDRLFWDLARDAKESIKGAGTVEDFSSNTTILNQLFFDKDVVATETMAEMMFQYDFLISNIGLIPFESSYGPFKIESMYGPALLFKISGENNIGVATINGALHLTHISRVHMDGLLPAVHEVLDEAVNEYALSESILV